ncbi:MAG: hypothetical protein ACYDA4_16870 [Ignavibacteriaceae bacterium]
MNQKNIDMLIPAAVTYLSDNKNEIVKDGNVESELSSYLSSFGPTIRQASMMKSLAVYTEKDSKAKRHLISNLIKQVLLITNVIDKKYEDPNKDLLYVYLENIKDKDELDRIEFEDKILEAIIACKLALSLFHIKKKNEIAR